jgi:hypothetical protein
VSSRLVAIGQYRWSLIAEVTHAAQLYGLIESHKNEGSVDSMCRDFISLCGNLSGSSNKSGR